MGLLEALGLRKPKNKKGVPPNVPQPTTTGSAGSGSAKGGVSADAEAERALAAAKRRYEAFAKRVEDALNTAQADVDGQPVAALKTTLEGELATLRRGAEAASKLDPAAAAAAIEKLDSPAHNFASRAASLRTKATEGQGELHHWAEAPVQALVTKVNALGANKRVFEPRLKELQKRAGQAKALLDAGEFDKLTTLAGQVYYSCQDLTGAIDNYARDYPPYKALRAKVVTMLDRMKGGGLMDGDGNASMADLENALGRADALGPIKGYASAKASLNDVVVRAKTVRDSNAAYKDYQPERAKVATLIANLKKHKQAAKLSAEIAQVEARLKEADELAKRPDGGSLKALTALKALTGQCAEHKALADKLEAAQAKLPALTKKLEAGVPKDKVARTAQYALKLLVEEECSEDDAVKMAKDANGYADEGLGEQDAIMSSRVKKSLEDSGLAPEHARAIGKNIRAGGTSSAADAKAVAKSMSHISKKAIDALTADDIHTECCRGPITDAIPELAGVKPRGWPETASWDDVPGVYSGGKKKLVVGTMADGGGRKVPATGEGPLPHGASDLFGHEAGHAFDAAKPGGKKDNAKFLEARQADVTAGNMVGGTDSYFMTAAEGGANDAGATSETFAESFAMHFKGGSRWPRLEEFWAANPWGI